MYTYISWTILNSAWVVTFGLASWRAIKIPVWKTFRFWESFTFDFQGSRFAAESFTSTIDPHIHCLVVVPLVKGHVVRQSLENIKIFYWKIFQNSQFYSYSSVSAEIIEWWYVLRIGLYLDDVTMMPSSTNIQTPSVTKWFAGVLHCIFFFIVDNLGEWTKVNFEPNWFSWNN